MKPPRLKFLAILALFITFIGIPVSAVPPKVTLAQLLLIAPASAFCTGASFPSECSTVSHALPFINRAFNKYNVTSAYERTAVLSLIAFETDSFRYSRNHYPGRPGQGTRNMQMSEFNLEYAYSNKELRWKVRKILGRPGWNGNGTVAMTDVQKDKILE